MCSVVGCGSGHRDVQRFELPADPERRLEWVQFLATVNKQRFKESSWTDIAICKEHFKDNSFEKNLTFSQTGTILLTLKPDAVPSLRLRPRSGKRKRPKRHVDKPKRAKAVGISKVSHQRDRLKKAARETPEGSTTNTSDALVFVYGRLHPKNADADIIREKAALLRMNGKCVVSEKRLLQLFSCKCSRCGSKVNVEKVIRGVLIIINQQCTHCKYRKQWKSQLNASVSAAEDRPMTRGRGVTPQTRKATRTDDTHVSSETSDESSDEDDTDADEAARPRLRARVHQKKTDDTTKNQDVESDNCPLPVVKYTELCVECGKFYSEHRPHICEYKTKPYSCNICGKRCVSEVALNCHSRIHDDKYVHRCKYCHVAFKTKGDKLKHEHTHLTEGKPYKCPDCSESFSTYKERTIHLEDHRGPRQLKCDFCGIEFCSPLELKRHLHVHTGVKPHKCSVCDRGFKQASHLKSHMRLHTGEKPFKCQQCDKSFNHKVGLKNHVQRYHTSDSGEEQEKEKINERESNTGDVSGNGNTKDRDPEVHSGEEGATDQVNKSKVDVLKIKKRSSGRPIGRPKRNVAGNLVNGKEKESEKQTSSTKRSRKEKQKSDSDSDFNPGEKEKEGSESDSDSDFNPGERDKEGSESDSDSDF